MDNTIQLRNCFLWNNSSESNEECQIIPEFDVNNIYKEFVERFLLTLRVFGLYYKQIGFMTLTGRYPKTGDNDIHNGWQIFRENWSGRSKEWNEDDRVGKNVIWRSRKKVKLESAKNLLGILNDELIAEKIGIPLEDVLKLKEEMK